MLSLSKHEVPAHETGSRDSIPLRGFAVGPSPS